MIFMKKIIVGIILVIIFAVECTTTGVQTSNNFGGGTTAARGRFHISSSLIRMKKMARKRESIPLPFVLQD